MKKKKARSTIDLCMAVVLSLIFCQVFVFASSASRDGFYSGLDRRLELLSQRQELLINIKEYRDLDSGECFYSVGGNTLHRMECR